MRRNPLVEQVLNGSNRDLQILAAQGVLPLSQAEVVFLQASLCDSTDEELAGIARESLLQLDAGLVARLVPESPPEVLDVLLQLFDQAPVLQAALGHRQLDAGLAERIAPRLDEDLQEALLLRQDLIASRPGLLTALETNPRLSAFARRRIHEYRQHLIRREETEEEPAEADPEEASEEEMLAAITEVTSIVPAEGDVDQESGLSEMQIRELPISVRLRLTHGAGLVMRNVLLRDNNPKVGVAVLRNSMFSELEIERICGQRGVSEDILAEVARKRHWSSKYRILVALVKNPKTPAGLSVRLVPRVSVRELRLLAMDRNVSDAVRRTAARVYKQKTG